MKTYHFYGEELSQEQAEERIKELRQKEKQYRDDFNAFGTLGMRSDVSRLLAVMDGSQPHCARFGEDPLCQEYVGSISDAFKDVTDGN